jgi:hypothetical protein
MSVQIFRMSASRLVSRSSVSPRFFLRGDSFPLSFHLHFCLWFPCSRSFIYRGTCFSYFTTFSSSILYSLCVTLQFFFVGLGSLSMCISIFHIFRNIYIYTYLVPSLVYVVIYSSFFTTYYVIISMLLLINSLSIFSFYPVLLFLSSLF